jgi:hypothetical protein
MVGQLSSKMFHVKRREQMDIATQLAALLGGKKLMEKPPTGSGMVDQAAKNLQSIPYQRHVQESKALGQEPMTPEQFAAQQK